MNKARAGSGEVVSWGITDDGEPWFRVIGQDVTTGHWAAFTVRWRWRDWLRVGETLDDLREEVAQARIPYE